MQDSIYEKIRLPYRVATPPIGGPLATIDAKMVDVLTREQRSALMARIRGKNTQPELLVRKLAHSLGYRFRLHQRKLPGSPDIVFARLKKVILVHGCFWHRHNCGYAYVPKTRRKFWAQKFANNISRDRRDRIALRRAGWDVLVIWECQTKSSDLLRRRVSGFLQEARPE